MLPMLLSLEQASSQAQRGSTEEKAAAVRGTIKGVIQKMRATLKRLTTTAEKCEAEIDDLTEGVNGLDQEISDLATTCGARFNCFSL